MLKEFISTVEAELGPAAHADFRFREAARYLKSRKFDLKEALAGIRKFYEFRASNEIELILVLHPRLTQKGEFLEEPEIRDALPHCLHHTDL